jgi:hypothetical protein
MTKHDQAIYIRVTAEDTERLDGLAERIELATRSSLARAAMRIGLEAIEQDPAVLFGQPIPKRGGTRRRKAAQPTDSNTLSLLQDRFAPTRPRQQRKKAQIPTDSSLRQMYDRAIEAGATQKELALAIGYTAGPALSQWRKGRKNLPPDKAAALAAEIEARWP